MADITCPECNHWWVDEDLLDEDELINQKSELEEQLDTKDKTIAEMLEFLKGFVDEFDKTPAAYSVTRTLTKAEIRTMCRLVEKA